MPCCTSVKLQRGPFHQVLTAFVCQCYSSFRSPALIALQSALIAIYGSKPLAAMGSKFVFQVVWFFVAAYSACRFANALTSIRRAGRFPPGPARLRVLGLRREAVTSPVPPGPLFASAGLLRDGCKLPVDGGGAALTLDFDGTLHLGNSLGYANGYFFATIGGESVFEPVRWVAEVSRDNGSTWDPVGASIWRFTTSGSPLLFPDLAYPMLSRTAVATEVRVDSRPQLPWILTTATEQLIFALLYFMMAAVGRLGRADLIVPLAASSLSLNALFIFAGISMAERSMWREAVRLSMYAIGDIFLALSTAREKHFIPALAAGNIFIMTSASIVEVVLYGRDLKPILHQQLLSLASFSGLFSLVTLFIRHSTLARAHRLVKLDRDRYEALWSKSLDMNGAVKAVSEQARALISNTEGKMARHLLPTLSKKCTATPVRLRSSGSIAYLLGIRKKDCEYLESLDQLFVQV
jgi:hypothetical protein